MVNSSFWPVGRGKTSERDVFLAPALYVSIAIAIFAIVTQLLAAGGAVSLSTTQLLAMWLVAGALIVVLWIAYMVCRAYVGLQSRSSIPSNPGPPPEGPTEETRVELEQTGAGGWQAEHRPEEPPKGPEVPANGSPWNGGNAGEDAWVPPGDLRRLDGTERLVSTAEVFPDGCCLQPDSIGPDTESKLNGQRAYQCRVVDLNPAKDRTHEAVVKILADRAPVPPTGQPYERVEFENLTMIPYVTDRSPMRIRYSLRATGIRAAAAPSRRVKAVWTAASNGQAAGTGQIPERPVVSR